jgi:tetratricopeptide (TPR) repeat protein
VDATGDHDLALELATAYIRIGRVQGVPIATNLGQTDNAEKTLRIAEGLVQAVLVAQPNNRTAMLRAAQIAHDRMVLAQGRRPSTEATPLARTSLRWLEMYLKVSDWSQLSTQDAEGAVIVGTNVANWLGRGDDPSGAINLLHTVADFARKTNLPRQAASAQIAMARTLRATGDLEGALTAIRAGITLLEPQRGEKSVGVVSAWGLALVTEGEILGEDGGVNLGRPKEAEALFARGYEAALGQAKQDPADSYSRFALASRGLRLAGVLQHTDPKRALEILDEVLRFSGEIKDNSRARRDEARTLSLSSYPLCALGRAPEARRRLDSAFDRLKNLKLFPADSVELGSEPLVALRALADYEAGTGNLTKSVEIYQQLLDKVMASKPTPESDLADANDMSNLYQAMAKLFRLNQRTERAAEFDRRSLELWTHWNRKLPGNPFVGRRLKEVQAASSH